VNFFVLTPEEKRVVAFIMLMILVGVCVKEYRKRHPVPPVPIEVQKHPWMRKLPPLPSPTATPSVTARPKRSRKPRKLKSPAEPTQPLPESEQETDALPPRETASPGQEELGQQDAGQD
jgi:hypothetical protein